MNYYDIFDDVLITAELMEASDNWDYVGNLMDHLLDIMFVVLNEDESDTAKSIKGFILAYFTIFKHGHLHEMPMPLFYGRRHT